MRLQVEFRISLALTIFARKHFLSATTEICFFHFQLIKSVDSKFLKLTQLDDEIYEEFRKEHPAFNVDVLNEEELKSPSAKAVPNTVKPVLSGHSKRTQKLFFKTDYRLMQVKSIAECSKGSILQYFRPSLSYHFSLRPLFCIFNIQNKGLNEKFIKLPFFINI